MAATLNFYPTPGGQEGASLAWAATMAAFVQSKNAALTKVLWRSACNSLQGDLAVGATTGTAETYLVNVPGSNFLKVRMTTGTTASSFRPVRTPNTTVAGGATLFTTLVANCRTSVYASCARVIIGAVNNTCQMLCANMSDEATQDAWLGVDGGTSQTTFSLKIGSAAAVDTTVAIGTLGVTEHDLVMYCDGTNINAYIDLNPTASATGLSNTAANAAGHVRIFPINGATTTNVSMDILQAIVFGA